MARLCWIYLRLILSLSTSCCLDYLYSGSETAKHFLKHIFNKFDISKIELVARQILPSLCNLQLVTCNLSHISLYTFLYALVRSCILFIRFWSQFLFTFFLPVLLATPHIFSESDRSHFFLRVLVHREDREGRTVLSHLHIVDLIGECE